MEQTKIGFDLDETLVYGDIIKEAGRQLGFICNNSDVTTLNLDGIPPPVRDKAIELFSDPIHAALNKKFLPGIPYLLKYLYDETYFSVHIITSRPEHLLAPTVSMFKASSIIPNRFKFHFPNKEIDIKLTDNRPKKLDIITKLKLDMYFDDAVCHCDEAIAAGVHQVFLVSNKHTPWNHGVIDKRIRRIKSILDLNSWEFHNGI